MREGFFLAGMTALGGEGGGTVLLGDNTGGGAVMLRPIRFQFVAAWTATGFPAIYTPTQLTVPVFISDLREVRLAPNLPERMYCPSSVCLSVALSAVLCINTGHIEVSVRDAVSLN